MLAELALEAEGLAALLARHDDDRSADEALATEGWYDLLPEPGGAHALVGPAALAVHEVARALRSVPVLARLLGASAAADAGLDPGGRWAVVLDGSALGLDGATSALVLGADGELRALPADALRPEVASPLDLEGWSHPVEVPGDAGDVLPADVRERHEARAALLLAVDALGVAGAAADRTRAYVRERHVMGGPLGDFQVVRHRLVDMALVTTLLGAAAEAALQPVLEPARCWSAKALAGVRTPAVAEQAVQLHGGTGFAWDSHLHVAVRRTQLARRALGGPGRAAAEVLRHRRARVRPPVTDWSRR